MRYLLALDQGTTSSRALAAARPRLQGAGIEPMVRDKTATKLAWLLAHLHGAAQPRRPRGAPLLVWRSKLEAITVAEAIRPSDERGEAKQRLHRGIGVGAHGLSVRLLRRGRSPDGI